MDNPTTPVDLGRIAQDLQIRRVQVESVVQLLDEGYAVPFIARYRKERTGGLGEGAIREIQTRVARARELAERKQTIVKTIEAQGRLTEELAEAIRAADSPRRLDDLYLPYRPKKRTPGLEAREKGLETLALRIWNRDETLTDLDAAAAEYVDPEKGLDVPGKVLEGVGHILAESISELAHVRDAVRRVVWKLGKVATNKAEGVPDGKGLDFRDYFAFSEPVGHVPPHRVLAINRGEKEGTLKVRLEVPRADLERAILGQLPLEDHPHRAYFTEATLAALDRHLLPALEREVKRELTELAERHAVDVFSRNLRSLLLQPPLRGQVVLAVDPGRKGCKVAVLDPDGHVLEHGLIHPTPPHGRRYEAKQALKDLVAKHQVSVVAIGNGTACREVEELVAETIAEGTHFHNNPGVPFPTPARKAAPAGAETPVAEAPAAEAQAPAAEAPATQEAAPAGEAPEAVAEAAGPAAGEGSLEPPGAAPDPLVSAPENPGAHGTGETPNGDLTAERPGAGSVATAEAPPPVSGGSVDELLAEHGLRPISGGSVDSGEASPAEEAPAPPTANEATPVETVPPPAGSEPAPNGEPGAHGQTPETATGGDEFTDSAPPAVADASMGYAAPAPPPSGDDPAAELAPAPEAAGPEMQWVEPSAEAATGEPSAAESAAASTAAAEPVADIVGPLPSPDSGDAGAAVHAFAEAPAPPATEEGAEAPATGEAPLAAPGAAATAAPGLTPLTAPPRGPVKPRAETPRPPKPKTPPPPPAPHTADALLAKLAYVVVNESGANVYSSSSVGREELPEYDAELRGTVSIGRRLQDPLAELVKVEPQHVGVGQYQHDVHPKRLKEGLDHIVEHCVNLVGVDLNTAGVALLARVAGLNDLLARRIVAYREQNGPLRSREQLRQVEGVNDLVFAQAAGFVRVRDGDEPLDRTPIHPESYAVARRLLETLGFGPEAIANPDQAEALRAKFDELDIPAKARELEIGEPTLRDILDALAFPGRDPRDEHPEPILKRAVLRLEDLQPGMELKGTVLNVVDFGAFVDIGLKDSGLVHISQLANRYIKNPHDVVSVGDVVDVWVMGVDKDRRRVSLTMIRPGTERPPRPERGPRRGGPEPRGDRLERERGGGERSRGPRPPRPGGPGASAEGEGRPGAPQAPRPGTHRIPGPPLRLQQGGGRGGRPGFGRGGPGGPGRGGFGRGGPGGRGAAPEADRDRDQGPTPPKKPRAAPSEQPLSKDALTGSTPLRSFGQLKQLYEMRSQGGEGAASESEAPAEPQAPSESPPTPEPPPDSEGPSS